MHTEGNVFHPWQHFRCSSECKWLVFSIPLGFSWFLLNAYSNVFQLLLDKFSDHWSRINRLIAIPAYCKAEVAPMLLVSILCPVCTEDMQQTFSFSYTQGTRTITIAPEVIAIPLQDTSHRMASSHHIHERHMETTTQVPWCSHVPSPMSGHHYQ